MDLPQEILEMILLHLDAQSLFNLRLTCQELRSRIPCIFQANTRTLKYYVEAGFRPSEDQIYHASEKSLKSLAGAHFRLSATEIHRYSFTFKNKYEPLVLKAIEEDDLDFVKLFKNVYIYNNAARKLCLLKWQHKAELLWSKRVEAYLKKKKSQQETKWKIDFDPVTNEITCEIIPLSLKPQ